MFTGDTTPLALESSRHSNKEESGFTHATNVEPVTFRPRESHTGDLPGDITWRPTGSSIMKNNFRQPLYSKVSLVEVCVYSLIIVFVYRAENLFRQYQSKLIAVMALSKATKQWLMFNLLLLKW